ncbi:MAG: 50S ribosomal protein L20 [Pseudomonadota bacterium]
MARIKRAQIRKTRMKNLAAASSGFTGGRGRLRQAKAAVRHAQVFAFIGRKQRKRQFRALWIQRIAAALMQHDLSYSRFIHGLNLAGITLDRKQLAALAVDEPAAFDAVVAQARGALG